MSYINSNLKTWLKRNGFRAECSGSFRECNGYVARSGRHFRIRKEEYIYGPTEFQEGEWIVDVSDLNFDRWANSCERTITLAQFKEEFAKKE